MTIRLSNASLKELPGNSAVLLPSYDRRALAPGIVHLGLGAFHRAHQAIYIEAILAAGDLRWGVVGVSLRQSDTRDALLPQDHLYTLAVRDATGERLSVIGALVATLVAPQDPQAVLSAMADVRCHIVSLTVTEKGYSHDPATRTLRFDHPDIVHDLAHPEAPCSAIGFVVWALALRHAKGVVPFTVLSCDNLPSNGDTTRNLVLAFAAAVDVKLAEWIAKLGTFPNSMVDRIVPKTTDEDRIRISTSLGADDAWPVCTEPFTQWVIEDRFAGPRPQWQDAGVTMVTQAEPYENSKLRMLNGSHSTLAYLGSVIGYVTVDEAMADVHLCSFVESMMRDEIEATLERPGLPEYRAQLLARFRNPVLKHKLQQIAMDGSQKLPQRLLGTIRDRLAQGADCERLCFAVAGWLRYLNGHDDHGLNYAISDPLTESLKAAVAGDATEHVSAFMKIGAVFGSDLPENVVFVSRVTRYYERIIAEGVAKVLQGFGQ